MAKRIIAIGGEPASGKTTLIRTILQYYNPMKVFKYKLVRGLYNPDKKLYVIGVYDDSTFSGTDKLSMAVQPDFIKLIEKLEDGVIIFEGDRLFNQSLFDKKQCDILVLNASEETLRKRHKKRNDNQSEAFLKSKRTKVINIIKKNNVTLLDNNTVRDYQKVVDTVRRLIEK